jgi:hypothetical protein
VVDSPSGATVRLSKPKPYFTAVSENSTPTVEKKIASKNTSPGKVNFSVLLWNSKKIIEAY